MILVAGGGLALLAGRLPGDNHAVVGDLPPFQNAQVEKYLLQGSLHEEIRHWASASTKGEWLGYAVAGVPGHQANCGSNGYSDSAGSVCALEENRRVALVHRPADASGKINLEALPEIAVMLRAEGGKVGKIRVFSATCVVDASGLKVRWLEGVAASESIQFLEQLVADKGAGERRDETLGKTALVALALHADAAADGALESFVSPERPEWLRKETAFWLGAARGAEGLQALEKMARVDPSAQVREQVTFALSVSGEPGAVTEMIRMAHQDEKPQVRGQALFWLAQKAGRKAETTITGAIQNDPDTEVKKKAVFALSQMPNDEGIPKLIQVAETNKNAEVRKQAMFWLGQSEDPRALAFFERVLRQ
jgi:hypothetical protein